VTTRGTLRRYGIGLFYGTGPFYGTGRGMLAHIPSVHHFFVFRRSGLAREENLSVAPFAGKPAPTQMQVQAEKNGGSGEFLNG